MERMRVPAHAFREYDIRGVADRDLSDELAESIGRGLGAMLAEGRKADTPFRIAVGRDCRLSSPRLHAALVRGLSKAGAHVVDIGVGPTPYLYFAVHHLDAQGGVQITGSHNPGDENGFKMMRGKASFFGPDIQTLRERIVAKDFGPETSPGKVEENDLQDAYVAAMKERFDFSKAKPFPFVLDAGNGAGGPLGMRAMKAVGLEPDPLFCDMDGRFPNHHPDPTVLKNLEALVARVKQTKAKVGLAYDGDADRLGAVDENGDVIWGDKLMILFARDAAREDAGRDDPRRGEVLADALRRHREARRQARSCGRRATRSSRRR
jgi:phosphomannomutase / phosphoglucomutase